MDDSSINLGLGFDSQNVGEATRELKKQVKTLGAMFMMFKKMKDATDDQSKAEENVVKQMKGIGVTAKKVLDGMGNKMKAMIKKVIPGSDILINGFIRLKGILGKIVGISLIPHQISFLWSTY